MLEVSLVTGWLPAALTALGLAALLWLAFAPLDRPAVLVIMVAGGLVVLAYLARPFPDPLPVSVLVWAWVGLSGVALGVLRLVTGRGPRRIVAALTGVVVLAFAGAVQINRYYGQYPTLGTALGLTRPALIDLSTVERAARVVGAPGGGYLSDVWASQAMALPANGTVSRVAIPGTVSGFRARDGYVYLPPAYRAETRPLLPVLVLLSGQPGNSDHWLVSGRLAKTMDEYAARHRGLAPVVVMPDHLGANFANPLCVDSKWGNAETYLKIDVPQWVRSVLQVSPVREQWAIGGLSNGGTCALQLARSLDWLALKTNLVR